MKTEEKSASNKKLISLCVIERALEGDIQAINKVLKHYEGYIAKLSIRKMYGTILPPELRTAHQKNDIAVMEAYGFDWRKMTESDCVVELMKMYQELINK